MSRQQIIHLFRAKMSRQLRAVDLIQQNLPTKRQYHKSRLLLYTLHDQLKPMFGYNRKLSMICTCSISQFPHFSV